ncbi:MAG: NAD-dependent epimerase/dehydratase family protein [Chroococcus sp. CMT-3BRIN-NPC107]|jgi:short-subunit dehydrogenase|nr:NAD-dependent epimerase/dehydratase family protein [Chroococcus sp. CMT-3BRIN-NPC107]
MKTAWVTGATGFWGRNVVMSLLRLDWRVVALTRSQPEDLIVWARSQNKELVWQHCDLRFLQLPELETPSALFHCAAVFDCLEIMMQVNVIAPIGIIESVLPQMQATGEGRIGIFLGQNGRIGLPNLGHFSATQGAMWTWAESQSRSLTDNVSLSLVFPPRAPSYLQGQLAEKLSKPPKLFTRPTADNLVKNVLLGHRCVGRRPILAGISTLLW